MPANPRGWAPCLDEACLAATFAKMSEHHQRFYGRPHMHPARDPRTIAAAPHGHTEGANG